MEQRLALLVIALEVDCAPPNASRTKWKDGLLLSTLLLLRNAGASPPGLTSANYLCLVGYCARPIGCNSIPNCLASARAASAPSSSEQDPWLGSRLGFGGNLIAATRGAIKSAKSHGWRDHDRRQPGQPKATTMPGANEQTRDTKVTSLLVRLRRIMRAIGRQLGLTIGSWTRKWQMGRAAES